METFLNTCKTNLTILEQLKKVYVVLGNEACDLDSVVSAVVTAYLFHTLYSTLEVAVFPIANVSREDLRLRTEVIYFLKKLNISLDLLICRDELNLQRLHNDGKLSVILVDHNVLASHDVFLENSVITIIDHHIQDSSYKDECDVTIELVGSCCTLVAEKVFQKQPDILDTQIATLLYGTIIFDTVCLEESAKRVTPKDVEIATKLEPLLTNIDKEEMFKELQKAKSDISDLKFDELLRKDLKMICSDKIRIAISSVPVLLQVAFKSQDVESNFSQFCSKHGYNAIVIMGININEKTSEIRRELSIYSPLSHLRQQITDYLCHCENPNLQLEKLDFSYPVFHQKNYSASRKAIIPLLNGFLLSVSESLSSAYAPFISNQTGNIEISDDLSDFDPLNAENADSNLGSPRYSVGSASLIGRLGVSGEPLSSQSSSAQNSCPYTPQNSFVDDSFDLDDTLVKQTESLPSFNSREMIEKIEHKRGKLRGYDKDNDTSSIKAIPFTPKNSFADSNFESYIPQEILNMDSDSFIEKVRKKKASLAEAEDFSALYDSFEESQADKTFVGEATSNGISFTAKCSYEEEEKTNDPKISNSQNSPVIPLITMTKPDKNENEQNASVL